MLPHISSYQLVECKRHDTSLLVKHIMLYSMVTFPPYPITHTHTHTHTHAHTYTELMVCSSGRRVGMLNLAV